MSKKALDIIYDFFNTITKDELFITDGGWNMTCMAASRVALDMEGRFFFKWTCGEKFFEKAKKELIELGHDDYIEGNVIRFCLSDEHYIELEKE